MAETLRASGRVSIAVATSRVLGLVRESIFASLFGSGVVADAYQVAYRIPNLLRDLFAEGALSSAFLPTFTASLVGEDKEAAYRLGNLALSGVLACTGVVVALGTIFAESVVIAISDGFSGSSDAAYKIGLATELTRIMMPLLSVVSLSAVWMGMLNAQKRFMAPAFAPAMFNLTSIAVGGGILLSGEQGRWAILAWGVGTLGSGLLQALVQLPALWRLGYRPWPRVGGILHDPRIRRIARLMGPAVFGLAAVQVNLFVNTRFAANLGDGPVSQLSYAFRLFYLPVGVFSVALATITTVRVSEHAARGESGALLESTAEGLRAVWMLMLGSTVGLLVLAQPVVEVIYQRGAFDSDAALRTAAVLTAYAVGLVPYGMVKILAPVFYGIDKARVPVIASMVAVAVNLSFNAATYRSLGAPGLALGTSLGAIANLIVLRIGLARSVGALPWSGRHLLVLLGGNVVMGGLVWSLWRFAVAELLDAEVVPRWITLVVSLAVVITLGCLVYARFLAAWGYPDARVLSQLPATIWSRLRRRR
ncbi:MAG: murein biosynthesis integral membrane protein MurJ [Nannocystaceae bacterium]